MLQLILKPVPVPPQGWFWTDKLGIRPMTPKVAEIAWRLTTRPPYHPAAPKAVKKEGWSQISFGTISTWGNS
jgi:hypothetical protein